MLGGVTRVGTDRDRADDPREQAGALPLAGGRVVAGDDRERCGLRDRYQIRLAEHAALVRSARRDGPDDADAARRVASNGRAPGVVQVDLVAPVEHAAQEGLHDCGVPDLSAEAAQALRVGPPDLIGQPEEAEVQGVVDDTPLIQLPHAVHRHVDAPLIVPHCLPEAEDVGALQPGAVGNLEAERQLRVLDPDPVSGSELQRQCSGAGHEPETDGRDRQKPQHPSPIVPRAPLVPVR